MGKISKTGNKEVEGSYSTFMQSHNKQPEEEETCEPSLARLPVIG